MRFAKEAWPFVLPFVLLAVALGWFRYWPAAAAAALLAILVLLFFRDPHRHYEGDAEAVLAPADGVILSIDRVEDAEVGAGEYIRIVTFLSVFDVHVQRTPVAGEITHSALTSGRKKAAFKEDLDRLNERHLTVIQRANGDRIGIRQIVGLLARRIVCYLKAGDEVQRGQSLGLIKFGSRVDLLVPASYRVLVQKGDRMRNGETVMARAAPEALEGKS